MERHGLLILIGMIFILPLILTQIGIEVNLFSWLVWFPVEKLFELITFVVGLE